MGVGLFSQIASDRTIGNGLKLHQMSFRLNTRSNFLTEKMKQVAQGSGGISIPGSVQKTRGYGLVVNTVALGLQLDLILEVFSTFIILYYYYFSHKALLSFLVCFTETSTICIAGRFVLFLHTFWFKALNSLENFLKCLLNSWVNLQTLFILILSY